jgi:hypothetical protein
MIFNGYNQSVVMNGQVARELEYVYTPFDGLSVASAIYRDYIFTGAHLDSFITKHSSSFPFVARLPIIVFARARIFYQYGSLELLTQRSRNVHSAYDCLIVHLHFV